jgi:hypothetical protein
MIKAYIQAFLAFIKSVFSDGGNGSFSRCGAAVIIGATISWVSYLVLKNHAIPDLQGPTWFMSSGVGMLYGTNKASDLITAWRQK